MSKILKYMIPITVLAALAWFWNDFSRKPVIVVEAKLGPIRDSVTGNVRVFATSTHDLRTQSQAVVKKVALMPMSKPIIVEKNQTLVELATDDLDRELEALTLEEKQFNQRLEVGSIVALQLKIEEMELNALEEQFKLEHGSLSLFDLERKRNEVDRLRAQVSLEKLKNKHFIENIALKRSRILAELNKRRITSPINGLFASSSVYPGNMVFAGHSIGEVYSLENVFEASLGEEDCEKLMEGMEAAVSLYSMSGKILSASVMALSPSVNSESGMRKVYLSPVQGENAPVGSSGRAEIIILEKNETLIIPSRALLGEKVLLESNGVIKERIVALGARNLKTVEVVDGLQPGDRVIVETPHLYKSGDRVSASLIGFRD